MKKHCVSFLSLVYALALFPTAGHTQSLVGKDRAEASAVLELIASATESGVSSGSCLRPIGDIGTEEFAVYLLLPHSKIEGFVVEFSGGNGGEGEIVANAGIVSFNQRGKAEIRGNNGLEWVAQAYGLAADFIRKHDMYEDESYAEAFKHLPTGRCPLPRWGEQ